MQINLNPGKYYKVEKKMTGRGVNDRVFEKKDYAFQITEILDDIVRIEYFGEIYEFDLSHARHNFKPALIYNDIKDFIVLTYITGSHAYGTNVDTSDTDYKSIFIFPDSWYSRFDFNPDWEEIREKNHKTNEEITYYSLRRFISLLTVNNPNMLEALDISTDCMVYKHPCMDKLLNSQDLFISKLCYKAFLGYGESQINKAGGQDKLSNWEKADMVRKTPLDFCFTFEQQGSIPINKWLVSNGMDQRFCGLNSIDHMHDMYGVYYDYIAHTIIYLKEIIAGTRDTNDLLDNKVCRRYLSMLDDVFNNRDITADPIQTLEWVQNNSQKMLGYKGINLDNSNSIRLSETPKDAMLLVYMSYNKDGYTTHCKQYARYLTWKKERNDSRWTDVEGHNQKIDGKNMLHCMRLINMSEDIVSGKGIVVKRTESEYLKSIRYGKVDLQTLILVARKKLETLEEKFGSVGLMDEPDSAAVIDMYNNILYDHKNIKI